MAQLDLLVLRHGPTAWNLDKRLQGHTDIPVDQAAMQQQWPDAHLPKSWTQRTWYCSPLQRARQTAEYFQLQATPEPALIEMNWGQWEGKRLVDLRAENPVDVQRLESAGLHLRAPGGESPAEVQQRLSAWAEQMMSEQVDDLMLGAVCHKGLIRALLSAATGWNMQGKPPVRLDFSQAQRFTWCSGQWALLEANLGW